MLLSFEQKFRDEHPDCRVEEEIISENLTRYHVVVGNFNCSESGVRELAFKYAWEERTKIPPYVEQLQLWRKP